MQTYIFTDILGTEYSLRARNLYHAEQGFRDMLVLAGYGVSLDRALKIIAHSTHVVVNLK